jgi:hypothetical protein
VFSGEQQLSGEAVVVQEDALGSSHPEVVETLSMLAEAMKRIGQSGPAEELYRRALAVQRELLGSDHPDLATTMTNLALLLRSCKRCVGGLPPLGQQQQQQQQQAASCVALDALLRGARAVTERSLCNWRF